MFTYHWEQCDLTCNDRKVTQTYDKIPSPNLWQPEVQDEDLSVFYINDPDHPDSLYSSWVSL